MVDVSSSVGAWKNPANVDLVKKLWAEGLSASSIAARIGGVSRNAVIGKVHRLGLEGRATAVRSPVRRITQRPKASCETVSSWLKPKHGRSETALQALIRKRTKGAECECAPDATDLVVPAEKRKGLQGLDACSCRWPIGDPTTPEFHFCHHNHMPGLPYCEFHTMRAFQVPRARVKPVPVDLVLVADNSDKMVVVAA
jgi:GcrA cell cycle regulator